MRTALVGRRLSLALAALALAACASRPAPSGATLDRIGDELKRAAASTAKPADSKKVGEALLPPLQLDLPKESAEAVEPRFDLAVSAAPAAQVFMAIVSGTRYSMLVPPDVSGSISVNLKNVTVREALEAIRDLYGYDFRITGNRILVQSNAMQSRVFKVNYLAGRRQGSSELRVTGNSIATPAGGTTAAGAATTNPTSGGQSSAGATRIGGDSSRVAMTTDADFWSELRATLSVIVGNAEGRSVVVNPISGVIVVRGLPADIRNVESFLKTTQLMIERQVMLEAKIVDVQLNREFSTGINWAQFGNVANRYAAGIVGPQVNLAATGTLANNNVSVLAGKDGALSTTASGKGFFGLAFQSANFAALLNFLETQGDVHVLSSPRLATLNNQKAVLKVGSDEFFVTSVSTTTTATSAGSTTTPSITVEPFFSGIALDVTPQIDDQGQIILHIHPAISSVTDKQKQINLGTLGSFNLPLAASTINESDSIVRVQDGQVVAIGGLMKQEQDSDRSQLPAVGDVPVLGELFGSRTRTLSKRELVILLKPTVIHGEQSWSQDLLDTQSRLQNLDPRHPSDAGAAQ